MYKQYQAVSIEKRICQLKKEYYYVVRIYDTRGRFGILEEWFYNTPKNQVIRYLRADNVEVGKYVENGGKLRLY